MAISVAYREMAGWPREKFTWEAFAGERKLMCAWSDRTALAIEIMTPPNNIYPYNDSGAFVTHIPQVEPFRHGKQSQGTATDTATYEKAVVTVNYSTQGIATGRAPNGTLISEWTETWADHKQLGRTHFEWSDGDKLEPGDAPGKIEPGMDYILVYHGLAVAPAGVLKKTGTVNSNAVSSYLLGLSFPAETVQYMGAQVKHSITAQGSTGLQVRYKFRYAPHYRDGEAKGWNWFWRSETCQYEQIYDVNGVVKKPYTPAEFNF